MKSSLLLLLTGCGLFSSSESGSQSNALGADGGIDASQSWTPQSLWDVAKAATCDRVDACCPGSVRAKCEALLVGSSGYENAFWWHGAPGVDLSKLVVDQQKANDCLVKLGGRLCEFDSVPAAQRSDLIKTCFAAVSGTLAPGASCHTDAECLPGNWCDTTCKPLPTVGQACKTTSLYTDNCSYLGSGDTGLYCKAGACVAQVANGGACALAMQCASYACTGTCGASFTDPGLCSYVAP